MLVNPRLQYYGTWRVSSIPSIWDSCMHELSGLISHLLSFRWLSRRIWRHGPYRLEGRVRLKFTLPVASWRVALFAKALIHLYYMAPVDEFVRMNPVCLKIYIDDITIRCTARNDDVVATTLLTAAKRMKTVVEVDLQCDIAVHKAAVVASSYETREKNFA